VSFLGRQRLRPGIGGVSSRPVDPAEAYRVENMVLQRDGVWKPRPGLVAFGSAAAGTITHVSMQEQGKGIVVEGGRLRQWADGVYDAVLDTGWPTSWLHHTIGGNGAFQYWVSPKTGRFEGGPSQLRTVETVGEGGSLAVIASSPQVYWAEQHGTYTLATRPEEIYWSDAGDSTTWTAGNAIRPQRLVGGAYGMVSISESQVLLLCELGIGMLMGTSPSNFVLGPLYSNIPLPFRGRSALACGDRVFVIGDGPTIYSLNPGMQRVSASIESEIEGLPISGFFAWYDYVDQLYCLSHSSAGKTWLYDLERNVWMGTWTRHLVGMGSNPGSDALASRFYGLGNQMVELTDGVYTDSSGAFTCAIETKPDYQQAPEAEKQASAAYVDGRGTWEVILRYRNGPDEAWTEVSAGNVAAPGWAFFPSNVYRERVVRLVGTPSSTLRFRGIELDERVTGVPA
jgi:hypothetical protein